MNTQLITPNGEEKTYPVALVTVVIIVLCIAVLGGGVLIWKKKNQEQVQELERQLEGFQNSEMSGLPDQPPEAEEEVLVLESSGGEKCFSSGVESVATAPDSTWYLNRNLHTGYQYKTAEDIIVHRDNAREEDGIEVFNIGTKAYPEMASLKAYDLHKRRYAHTDDAGVAISYDAASDLWYKTSAGRAAAACVADEFMTTTGGLPVYMISQANGMQTYLVLAKINPAKATTTAFLLEVSVNSKNPDLPKGFLSDLEGFVQSVERIGGQYPF